MSPRRRRSGTLRSASTSSSSLFRTTSANGGVIPSTSSTLVAQPASLRCEMAGELECAIENREASLLDVLRLREVGINSSRCWKRYDVARRKTFLKVFRPTGQVLVNINDYRQFFVSDPCHGRLFAVCPSGRFLLKVVNVTREVTRLRIVHLFTPDPAFLTLSHSLLIENVPRTSPTLAQFSQIVEGTGMLGVFTMDSEMSGTNAANVGNVQSVLRLDLFVPWANAQLSTVATANFALRLDANNRHRSKRCFRVHSRGAVINCGYQVVFLTILPVPLLPIDTAEEPRKIYVARPVLAPLGEMHSSRSEIEKPVSVDLGETLWARRANVFVDRETELKTRMTFAIIQYQTDQCIKKRLFLKSSKLHAKVKRMKANQSCQMYIARQVVSVEQNAWHIINVYYNERGMPLGDIRFIDYEVDLLNMDESTCSTEIGVTMKVELHLKSGETLFQLVYVGMPWYFLEGFPGTCTFQIIKKNLKADEIFDSRRWYMPNPEEEYAEHEQLFSDDNCSGSSPVVANCSPELVVVDSNALRVERNVMEEMNESAEWELNDEMDDEWMREQSQLY